MKFLGFYEDMAASYQKGMQLDRIDNNGDYCKDNCKWSTSKEQGNNRRSNHTLTAFGRSQTITQWADETGIKKATIQKRVTKYGMDVEAALIRRVA
jgi:hypothetical protein